MSNRMKKGLACLLCLLLLTTAMLSGCGTQATPAASSAAATTAAATTAAESTTEATTAEPTPEPLDPVTLTQYVVGSEQPDIETVVNAMNAILQPKINATLDLKLLDWGTYDQKLKLTIAAAEAFDMCFTSTWMNNYHDNVNKGAFLPLDDLMAAYAPNAVKAIPQKFWDAAKVNGKTYGFLNYQIYARTDSIYIRNDIAQELGFDPASVKALKDLTPFLDAVSKQKKDMLPINGKLLSYNQTYGYEPVVSASLPGAILMDDMDAKVFNQFASPEYLEAVTLLRDWYVKGYYPKDFATLDATAFRRSGKFAVETGGTYKPGGVAELASMMNLTADKFTEVLLSETYGSTSGTIATMTAISATSENPERAMMYLELINTDKDLYNTMCFGIKDTHYTVDADGYVEAVANTGWNPSTDWEFGNQFNALYRKGNEKGNWEKTIELNENAVASPVMGFVFNPEPVKTEIAQCQAVVAEYEASLDSGSADLEKAMPDFLDKLQKAGSETLVAEIQKQVDAWKSTR